MGVTNYLLRWPSRAWDAFFSSLSKMTIEPVVTSHKPPLKTAETSLLRGFCWPQHIRPNSGLGAYWMLLGPRYLSQGLRFFFSNGKKKGELLNPRFPAIWVPIEVRPWCFLRKILDMKRLDHGAKKITLDSWTLCLGSVILASFGSICTSVTANRSNQKFVGRAKDLTML